MKAGYWRILALTAVLTAAADRDAIGCSCGWIGSACEAASEADVVFAGTVLSVETLEADATGRQPYQSILVKFQIEQGFINAAPGPIEIGTGMGGGDCGYAFKAGSRYVVYATKRFSARLYTGICSRTRSLAEAQDDLRYLTSMPSPNEGGRIFGRVNESKRDPAEERAVDYGPVEGVTVSIHGAGFQRDVVTGADGRFLVSHVPFGKVAVTVVPSFGFATRGLGHEFEIKGLGGCGEVNLTIWPTASAFGAVVDASGRPLAGVEVDAVAAELAGFMPAAFQRPARSDDRGIFEFTDLPPGTYVFGINLTAVQGLRLTGKPVFLPGTAFASDAARSDLKPGDRQDLGVLRLADR